MAARIASSNGRGMRGTSFSTGLRLVVRGICLLPSEYRRLLSLGRPYLIPNRSPYFTSLRS
jgi:hypothetical protein